VKVLVVAAVCDHRLLFISTAWSALIEPRYNFFLPPGVGVEDTFHSHNKKLQPPCEERLDRSQGNGLPRMHLVKREFWRGSV